MDYNKGNIIIYQSEDGNTHLEVRLDDKTVWLSQQQMAELYQTSRTNVVEHIKHIYEENELTEEATCQKFRQVRIEGTREVTRELPFYNLDMIISLGYRVKSSIATKFRQWATARLKDYLIRGYAINEKRLQQKQQEVEFLKTGLRIVSRALESVGSEQEQEVFHQFSKGLALLDDYDHEALDQKGLTQKDTIYPQYADYMELVWQMYSNFKSSVFAKPKDESFHSSINQIKQSFEWLG